MDLSSIGIAPKEFRVIEMHGKRLISDFIAGKFLVLAIECNVRGNYSSPIQQRLKAVFPSLFRRFEKRTDKYLGNAVLLDIFIPDLLPRKFFVSHLFLSEHYGLDKKGKPVSRYSEKHLRDSIEQMLWQLRKEGIDPDRQIAVQRFYGGLGGVYWETVQAVLDDICEKHKINIFAYLPKDHDTKIVA